MRPQNLKSVSTIRNTSSSTRSPRSSLRLARLSVKLCRLQSGSGNNRGAAITWLGQRLDITQENFCSNYIGLSIVPSMMIPIPMMIRAR
jgi:hypothetical protein